MSHYNFTATIAIVAFLWTTHPAQSALVTLEGDFGTLTWSGATLPLAVGNSLTETFSTANATGSITGEIYAENFGTSFDLRITNLVYVANADGAAPGAHSIELLVGQEYVATPGPYLAEHSLNGTTDLGAGQDAFALLMSTHNFSSVLPGVSDTASGPGTNLPLSAGPASLAVNTNSNIHVIEARLILSFNGGFATPISITLPASADISALLVPEPAAAPLLTMAGLIMAMRRRRNPTS